MHGPPTQLGMPPERRARRQRRALRRSCRRQLPARGVAALEMALVLPLVLLFAFASVDFGRVVHAYIAVSNAARCGAEYGSMDKFTSYTRDNWESGVQAAIDQEMQGLPGFVNGNLANTVTTTTDSDGLFLAKVEVTYSFHTIVNWPGVPSNVAVDHQVTMRQIR